MLRRHARALLKPQKTLYVDKVLDRCGGNQCLLLVGQFSSSGGSWLWALGHQRPVEYRALHYKLADRIVINNSPFRECLLVPLESPERYDFFTLLVPDFKKRIVAILAPYPWRTKDIT